MKPLELTQNVSVKLQEMNDTDFYDDGSLAVLTVNDSVNEAQVTLDFEDLVAMKNWIQEKLDRS